MGNRSGFSCSQFGFDGVVADGCGEVVGRDEAVVVARQPGDLEAALFEIFAGLEHGVVLDFRGDDVLALLGESFDGAPDCPVVRLCSAAGEEDFVGLRAD